MLKSHVKFNSKDGKRLILIVDDEPSARELLSKITEKDFEAVFAADGKEAIDMIYKNADYLSLVLLDLKLPVMNGFEVLRKIKEDHRLRDIPVIMLTSEEQAEVDSLNMGAADFITKPFKGPATILARMQKTIELFEDRHIIESTERDHVTGLFTREFFFRYCEQYDRYHPDMAMDAVSVDINHFHLINELYGRKKGDEVLAHLADFLKQLREETNCTICRIQADKFLVYMPAHAVDHEAVADEINTHFDDFKDVFIRVRVGVYKNVDKSISIERRFDRAMRANAVVKGNYSHFVSYYDEAIHEKKIFEDRLLNDFEDALVQEQFYIHYQPKFNVSEDEPVLVSAEALVRWKHPELGSVSPGQFIPLLEKNGLIQKLDFFVWEKAMQAERVLKNEYGWKIPISVNVSRMDLYIHDMAEHIEELLERNDVNKNDIYLEITESAYAENSEQIIEMINKLKAKGFVIEMDDFGTGYSSLNMLAELPVDVLKLDMRFVQNLHSNEKQEKMLGLVIDIAQFMSMQIVAEGVENEDQLNMLRSLGCVTIQGYYFSKPLALDDFIKLVEESRVNKNAD